MKSCSTYVSPLADFNSSAFRWRIPPCGAMYPKGWRRTVFTALHNLAHPSGTHDSETRYTTFRVPKCQHRCRTMVTYMSPLSTGEDHSTHCDATRHIWTTIAAFPTHPHRRRQTAPTKQRPSLPLHRYRPVHALGGSHSNARHDNKFVRTGFPTWLDKPFRHTYAFDICSWRAIYLRSLAWNDQKVGHRALTDNCLPPPSEWSNWAFPQDTQSFIDDQIINQLLDRWASLGATWSPHVAQRRSTDFHRRTGLRCTTSPTWWICSTESCWHQTDCWNLTLSAHICVRTPVYTGLATRYPADSGPPQALRHSEYVYLRRDAAKPSLSPPYEGPFKVLERRDKTFIIVMGEKQETVSLDRLKPAHIDPDQPIPTPPVRRRGRRSRCSVW